jgi:PPE-repeat protein
VLVNGESYHGGEFKWSLPEDDKPGEWTPVINNAIMCKRGYHLTTHYAHWSDRDNIEVYEAEGDVVEFDGYDKVVCSRVRLLKRVENPFPDENRNSGDRNSGDYNSGDWNSGDRNSGDRNSGGWNSGSENSGHYNSGNCNFGDRNSGNENSGDRNSGSWNFGDWNSGYMNSGNYNSGDCNSGNCNSGNCNSGDGNSGHHNSGDRNSGDRNSGDKNFGNWNSGHRNSGYLCTQTPPVYLFDKPAPKEWDGKFPSWMYFNLISEGYKASWQRAFRNASIKGVRELINLPNFDFKVFEEISSITEEQIRNKLGGI